MTITISDLIFFAAGVVVFVELVASKDRTSLYRLLLVIGLIVAI